MPKFRNRKFFNNRKKILTRLHHNPCYKFKSNPNDEDVSNSSIATDLKDYGGDSTRGRYLVTVSSCKKHIEPFINWHYRKGTFDKDYPQYKAFDTIYNELIGDCLRPSRDYYKWSNSYCAGKDNDTLITY